jgi:hypothetical protein
MAKRLLVCPKIALPVSFFLAYSFLICGELEMIIAQLQRKREGCKFGVLFLYCISIHLLTLRTYFSILSGGEDDNGPDGECVMHIASLMLGLALSLVERKSGNVVVNRWAPFQDLFKLVKAMMTHLFGKKNKGRYADYEKTLKRAGQKVYIADLPNDTRVAGSLNLIRDAMRQAYALQFYAEKNKTFENKVLNKREWKQLAEFEAVMSPSGAFCFTSQSDRVEACGETIIELLRMKDVYDNETIYEVVDMTSRSEWSADTPLDSLPRIKMATTQAVAEQVDIP